MDATQVGGVGFVAVGAVAALLATLRYVKSTEADSVDTLRATVDHLETQVKNCRAESALFRHQIDQLVMLLRAEGLGVPDGFWDPKPPTS